MNEDADFVLRSLKETDQVKYLACLYIPEDVRADVATLWAFDAEIARIPDLVSEPMPGEIRLQWWRDLLKSGDSGNNVGSGPLARRLITVIERHNLPRQTFDTYLQARIFDLYQDPMPDTGTFEGYLGETVSALFQNAAGCMGVERTTLLADACGHAGMAAGVAGLLSATGVTRTRKQLFFPIDMLEKHGLDHETWLGEEIYGEHLEVLGELNSLALYHLTFSRKLIGQLPQAARPVFLSLALVEPVLNRAQALGGKVFEAPISLSAVKQHWHLLCAAMRDIP